MRLSLNSRFVPRPVTVATALFFGLLVTALPAFSKTINVQSPPYSAVGNGVADDSAAVASAIAAAKKGDTVLFPAGTYYLPELGAANVSGFTLSGNSNPTLDFANSQSNSINLSNNSQVDGLTIINGGTAVSAVAGAWSISNCVFSACQTAVLDQSAGVGTVSSCTFNLGPSIATGLSLAGGTKVTVQNSTFNGTGANQSDLMAIFMYDGITTLNVTSNTFNSVSEAVSAALSTSTPATLNVTSNTFDSDITGLYLVCSESNLTCKAQYNIFSDTMTAAQMFGCEQLTFNANTISGAMYGYVDNTDGSVSITNNAIDSTTYPIQLSNDIMGATISGNTITRFPFTQDSQFGFGVGAISVSNNESSLKIIRNNITGLGAGIATNGCSAVSESQNTLDGLTAAISSTGDEEVTIQSNTINNSQDLAVFLYADGPGANIANNQINNIGENTDAPAVIALLSNTTGASITKNTYNQSGTVPPSLEIFIFDNSYTATLSGNKTNTMLPDFPPQ